LKTGSFAKHDGSGRNGNMIQQQIFSS